MMPKRLLCWAGLIAISAAVYGQAGKAKTWTSPRTAFGQPDLQGTWSNASNTPFERPKELGAKEFYTEQEFAEASKRGFLGDRGGPQEVHYDFGQYGMDALQSKF